MAKTYYFEVMVVETAECEDDAREMAAETLQQRSLADTMESLTLIDVETSDED